MNNLKVGQLVSFETQKKQTVSGEIKKIFIAKDDNKEYCTIVFEGKKYTKQTNKIICN
jgi:hypothetical protein